MMKKEKKKSSPKIYLTATRLSSWHTTQWSTMWFLRTEALLEHHADHERHHLDPLHLLGRRPPHGMGRLRLRAHEDLLHVGLHQRRQVELFFFIVECLPTWHTKDDATVGFFFYYVLGCLEPAGTTWPTCWPWWCSTWPSQPLPCCRVTTPSTNTSRRSTTTGSVFNECVIIAERWRWHKAQVCRGPGNPPFHSWKKSWNQAMKFITWCSTFICASCSLTPVCPWGWCWCAGVRTSSCASTPASRTSRLCRQSWEWWEIIWSKSLQTQWRVSVNRCSTQSCCSRSVDVGESCHVKKHDSRNTWNFNIFNILFLLVGAPGCGQDKSHLQRSPLLVWKWVLPRRSVALPHRTEDRRARCQEVEMRSAVDAPRPPHDSLPPLATPS